MKTQKNFIEEVLDLYEDIFPFETVLKLKILKWKLEKKELKEIKKYISHECSACSSLGKAEISVIKDSYLKGTDNKKLSRIIGPKALMRFQNIPSLLYLIGIDCFVSATLQKFPYPVTVGFPFNSWSPDIMARYIALFFYITDTSKEYLEEHQIKFPSLQTIRNSLNKNIDYYKKNCTLEEILNFYLDDFNNTFYMLHFVRNNLYSDNIPLSLVRRIKSCTYKLSLYVYDINSNFVGNELESENASDLSTASSIPNNPDYMTHFKASIQTPILRKYFKTAESICTNKNKLGTDKVPVYLINTNVISLNRYYDTQKYVPFTPFILIDDFSAFCKLITKFDTKKYPDFSNMIKTYNLIEKKYSK